MIKPERCRDNQINEKFNYLSAYPIKIEILKYK